MDKQNIKQMTDWIPNTFELAFPKGYYMGIHNGDKDVSCFVIVKADGDGINIERVGLLSDNPLERQRQIDELTYHYRIIKKPFSKRLL